MEEGKVTAVGVEEVPCGETPRSAKIASRGISTADDAASFLSAGIGDVMTGKVKERTFNSACNAMGKLLKVHDMKMKHQDRVKSDSPLVLAEPSDSERTRKELRRQELERELAALNGCERVEG